MLLICKRKKIKQETKQKADYLYKQMYSIIIFVVTDGQDMSSVGVCRLAERNIWEQLIVL